jgi:hypothetical protein
MILIIWLISRGAGSLVSLSRSNTGEFHGFTENTNIIKYFTLSDNYIGIANLTVKTSSGDVPVPEPSTVLLLSFGLVGIAGLRRKFSN